MEYSKEELKILLKKVSGYNAWKTKAVLYPYIDVLSCSLKDDDKIIIIEPRCFIGIENCLFVLLANRLMFVKDKTSHELYFENIASFQKSQSGAYCSIVISDAGNRTYEFKNLNPQDADIVISFLQKKEINVDSYVNRYDNLSLNIEKKKNTMILCVLLGIFGAHRFYTGYFYIGIVQLLLLLFCFPLVILWVIIDLVSIIKNKYKTVDGFALTV